MTVHELSAEVLALIHGAVRTIAHVEVLLALYARRPETCTSTQAADATTTTTLAGAVRCLDELTTAGLVARVGDDAWRFAPRDAVARAAVERLAAAYDERPVTLMRALYERPARPLQSFTDAFRLRGDG